MAFTHKSILLQLCLLTTALLLNTIDVSAQVCDPQVPNYVADLTGNPDSVWISPQDRRQGGCCGVNTGPPDNERCISFTVTLDPGAEAIRFEIASGAVPPGALGWRLGGTPCDPVPPAEFPVGQDICVGPGTHEIIFCKPGNNPNTYRITSISSPSIGPTEVVSNLCTGEIYATGYDPTTINWRSVPNNPIFDAALSCSTCDTTVVTYQDGFPNSVDYEVCGFPIGGCSATPICDTTTVYFVSDIAVDILPDDPVLCFGGPPATLTAHASGGFPPYIYQWSNGDNDSVTTAGIGDYWVTVVDTTGCPGASDSVTVTAFPSPIVVDAGPDVNSCENNPDVVLDGDVQIAGGGQWSGGLGTYSPSADSVDVVYTPDPSEITGTVTHVLTSTGNGLCPPETDTVIHTILPTPVVDAGPDDFTCANNLAFQLSGSVLNAGGGRWSGGGGTYFPNDSTVNAIYTPSAAEVTAGTVTLTLTSIQNQSCTPVADDMELTILPAPTVDAGNDTNLCANNNVLALNGSVTNATGGTWTSTGDGAFGDPNSLSTTYTAGPNDISNGTVTLTLTTTGHNAECNAVADQIVVTIDPAPTVNAGLDRTVCGNNANTVLNGSVTVASGGTWTTAGDGTFTPDANTLNATYRPGVADTAAGTVTLTLTSTGNGLCNAVVDDMTITINQSPWVDAGGDQIVCANNAVISVSGSIARAGGATWSTSGSGTFGNTSNLNTTYTPSAADTAAGSVTITLTTTGNGLCSPVNDQLTLTITPAPYVDAGPDQTVCSNNPDATMAGFVSAGATGGTWSTSGDGSFADPNILNTVYTPGPGDTTNGTVTLTLTSTGNGTCNARTDQMILTITDAPTANAGVNQTVCANNAVTTLNGAVTVATGGQWSTAGDGTFGNINNLNTTYTPGSGDIAAGTVNITLTTTGNGTCNAVADVMTINITPAPTVNAGGDQFACANNVNTCLNGVVTIAAGGTWTGGGGAFSPNSNDLNACYTPTAAEVSFGATALVLTSTGNGNCIPVRDTMVIFFTPAPTSDAGPDQTVCANNSLVTLNGSGTNNDSQTWSTLGSGVFANANNFNTTYTPSSADTVAGSVTLILTTNRFSCNPVRDSMVVTITPSPIADAGPDQTVCANNALTNLSGAVTNATGGQWFTPDGSGTFANITNLNTTYTPSNADTAAGSVTIGLITTGIGTCIADSSLMTLTIDPSPLADAGPDQTVCANNATVTLNGSVTRASGGQWTTSGTGTFVPNATTLNATYIPSAADTTAGSVTLTLTTTGVGNCIAVADQMTITITPSPGVNAGPDQTICADNPAAVLNGVVTVASGGQWIGGGGSFNPNNTTLNATYNASAAEVSAGTVTLTLVTTGNGNCNLVSDDVTITILPAPIVNAGNDQSACASVGSISINGTVTNAGGGTWTTSGSGSFANANALNTDYTPSAADTTAGSVTLTLTSTGNGPCNAVTDQMVITFVSAPSVDAGPDQIVCTNDLPIQLNASGSPGTWSGGAGTFSPSNANQNATYQPSAGEITATTVTLTFSTNPIGPCASISDDVTIDIPPGPVVNAGPDSTVCGDIANFGLSGSVVNAAGGIWSTDGTGSFSPNANVLNADYIPSASDISFGTITLVLTSAGNGSCSAETDTMILTITPAPTVSAGPDMSRCADQGSINLNGVVTVATGGLWSTPDGTGGFSDPTDLNATYTFSVGDTAAGTVTFVLETTGNGTCNPVTDTMVLTITPAPRVDAGADQVICADVNFITLNGSVLVASGAQWSTPDGSGTFSPNTTTLNAEYYPSAADTAAGLVTLILGSTGNGTCNAVNDTMELTITPAPKVDAGPNATVCADAGSYTLNGDVLVATGGTWTTSGTGTFDDANLLNATYTFSAADTVSGFVVLTLTSTGNGTCNAVVDQMVLTITPAPKVDAGPDQTVCADAVNVSLNGSVTVATGGAWSTPDGTGSFADPNALNTTYAPSAADTVAGSVTIVLTTTGNGTCTPTTDTMIITITPAPKVDAGPDDIVCADAGTYTLNGSVLVATGGQWTTTGTGTLNPNDVTLNATYTITNADTTAGSVTFTLTSTGNGTCTAVSDDIVLTITPAPKVNAGADQVVCADVPGVNLNGSVLIATGGVWTSSGTGTFDDSTSLNAVYVPSAADTTAGMVTLTLTSTGNGTCNQVTDQMRIFFDAAPKATAGPDQTICADRPTFNLGGSVVGAGGGTWTTDGTGTFNPGSTNLSATYNITAADTTAGLVTFFLETTGNGSCAPARDTMELTITPAPKIDAGPDITICGDSNSVPLSGSVQVSSGGLWSTFDGSGSFAPSAADLNATYVLSSADSANGFLRLVLETTGNGTCNAITDTLELRITAPPTVNAGANDTVCASSPSVALNGSITVASGAIWSTASGQGTFTPNNTTLNATFTPSAAQIAAGTVVLTLTTTGNGQCNPVSDNKLIIIQQAVVADAGPNQTVCSNAGTVNMNGTITNASGAVWSTSGTGTFNNDSLVDPVYTPSNFDTTAKIITLHIMSTGNGVCPAAEDSVLVAFNTPPKVDAGPAAACADASGIALDGTFSNAGGVQWTTSGSGTFSPASTSEDPTYTPSGADQAAGNVEIVISTTGNGPCPVARDTMQLGIQPLPTVNAGLDRIVCANQAGGVALNGSVTNAGGGVWTSSGGGSFAPDSATLNANYGLSPLDIFNGTTTLTLTTTGTGLCPSVSDQMRITITPAPTAEAGPNQTVCSDTSGVQLNGSVTIATGGTWTTPGDGAFNNPNILNPVYTPGAADIAAGSVRLTLTTTGNGTCVPVTDSVLITITPAPTISTSPDDTICGDVALYAVNASFTVASGVTWTTDGSGSFSSPTDNPVTYSITSADTANGSLQFIATTTGNGQCRPVRDTTDVLITPAPIISAGAASVCASVDTVPLSVTVFTASGVAWTTTDGTGTFTPDTSSLNVGYIPSAADKTAGSVTIVVQSEGNGTCNPVYDTIVLNVSPPPFAFAGPNDTVCANNALVSLDGSYANAGGIVWTTSGSGTFADDTDTTTTYTPSAADTTAGQIQLFITNTGTGLCAPDVDTLDLLITPAPKVQAGPDTICSTAGSVALNGSVLIATGAVWSSTGDGAFVDPNDLNTTYILGPGDLVAPSFTITLTSTGNGTCIPVADSILVNRSDAPTADAGVDDAVCANNNIVSLSGNVINASGGQWSTPDGTGSFGNTTNLNTTYTPSQQDIDSSGVTIVLTTTGNGFCSAVTDTMLVNITPAPVVDAGPDTVCSNNPTVALSGTVTTATGGTWSTSGTGTFDDPNALITNYNPTAADISGGSVMLTLTSTGNGDCNPVSDNIFLNFTAAPTADAGPPQVLCADADSIVFAGAVTNAGGGLWTTTDGTGNFSDSTDLTGSYYMTNADTTAGALTFVLTTTNVGNCLPVSDTLDVTITPAPKVDAGPDTITVCADTVGIDLNGTVQVASGGIWTTSGTGTFNPDNTTLNAQYVPSAADTAAGSVTLVLETTGNGTCNPVRDTLTIIITPAPKVDAGPATVCSDAPGYQLDASVIIASGGTWTSSGTGSFVPNANTIDAIYVHTSADSTAGSVVLTLTSTGNGQCNPVSDDMTLFLTPAPVASAGGNQTICADVDTIFLNGTVQNAGGGLWATPDGSGSIDSPPSLNTHYLIDPADTVAGSVTFTFTTTGVGSCNPDTDTIVIDITPAPVAIVNAGSDTTVCADNPNVQLNGQVSVATGGEWSSDGTGFFSPSTSNLNASYLPDSADLANGSVEIVLSTTGNGICNPVRDTMIITYTPRPEADAGPDTTICGDGSGYVLNGVVNNAGGGVWFTSGSGTFTPDTTTLNATYTPSAQDRSDSIVILTLGTTGNGGCNQVFDNMTLFITPRPVVNAGFDQTVCADAVTINLSGTAQNADSIVWTTSGTGTFADSSSLNTTYTMSAADTAAGSVTITLTSFGHGFCSDVSDNMVLTIGPAPVADAGPASDTICASDASYPLSGNVTAAGGGFWTTSGSGTFSPDAATLNASYFPSVADTTAGSVTLVLQTTGVGTCIPVTDTLELFFQPVPRINAGPNQTVCADAGSVTMNGTFFNVTGAFWSTAGSGTFTDTTDMNAGYTITAGDISAGAVIINLTSTGNGYCNPRNDAMVVTITPAPTVNAGLDRSICADASGVTLNGSVTVASGGVWSTTGSGTFSDTTDLNAFYSISSADSAAGTVDIILTTTGNGTCNPVRDTMTLTITPIPQVSAGNDTTICADAPSVQFSSSITVATGGSWATSGTGTFSPNNTVLNPNYAPSAADRSSGSVILTLTSTGNGTCFAYSDQLVLTITPAPTIDAGPDDTICADAGSVPISATTTVATGGSWATFGTGVFADSTLLSTDYFPSAADISNGQVTIRVVSTGNGQCNPVSDNKRIIITPAPTVNAGVNQTICADAGSTNISGSVTVASGGRWSTTGSGTFGNINNLSTTYSPSAADTAAGFVQLILTTTGNGLCNAVRDTMDLIITPVPLVSTGGAVVCADTSGLPLSGTVFNAGGGEWSSTGTGYFAPNEFNLTGTYVPSQADIDAGFVVITLTSTGNGTCNPVSDDMNVIITPLPISNAGPDQLICRNDSTDLLNAVTQTGVSYEWWTTGGVMISPTGFVNVTANNDTAFVLAATDQLNCTVYDTVEVFVTDPPTFNLQPYYCFVTGLTLDAAPSAFPGGTFQWYRNDTLQFMENDPNNHVVGNLGEHVIAYNEGRCSVFDTTEVVPLPALSSQDKFVCVNDTTTLSTTFIPLASYQWALNGGPVGTDSNRVNVTIVADTSYIVEVTDSLSCVNYDTVSVTAVPPPNVVLNVPALVCVGDTVLLDAEPTNIIDTVNSQYAWSVDGGLLPDTSSSILTSQTGEYTVVYTLGECQAFDTADLVFNTLPVPVNNANQRFCQEQDITDSLDAGPGADYFWFVNSDTTRKTEVNAPGVYYVEIFNAAGCSVIDSIKLRDVCPPRIFIPNALTPNGDGIDDGFYISGAHFTDFELTIFNRWGEIIFYTTDRYEVWYGKYRNEDMPPGVYPFTVKYRGDSEEYNEEQFYTGAVMLIR